jgi:hypothetical protein
LGRDRERKILALQDRITASGETKSARIAAEKSCSDFSEENDHLRFSSPSRTLARVLKLGVNRGLTEEVEFSEVDSPTLSMVPIFSELSIIISKKSLIENAS